jgi:predicted nuclease of predicted toxin-antitoxin system
VKLLFDENLSPRLVALVEDLFPESAHVHRCGLGRSEDAAIWEYAKSNGFTVVSKDSDFQERSVVFGSPPRSFGFEPQTALATRSRDYFEMSFPRFWDF